MLRSILCVVCVFASASVGAAQDTTVAIGKFKSFKEGKVTIENRVLDPKMKPKVYVWTVSDNVKCSVWKDGEKTTNTPGKEVLKDLKADTDIQATAIGGIIIILEVGTPPKK